MGVSSPRLWRTGDGQLRHHGGSPRAGRRRYHALPAASLWRRGPVLLPYRGHEPRADRVARRRLWLRGAEARRTDDARLLLPAARPYLCRLRPHERQRTGSHGVCRRIPGQPPRGDQQLLHHSGSGGKDRGLRHHPRPRLAHLPGWHPRQAGERKAALHPRSRHRLRPVARTGQPHGLCDREGRHGQRRLHHVRERTDAADGHQPVSPGPAQGLHGPQRGLSAQAGGGGPAKARPSGQGEDRDVSRTHHHAEGSGIFRRGGQPGAPSHERHPILHGGIGRHDEPDDLSRGRTRHLGPIPLPGIHARQPGL